jgi:hypothetical protein
MLKSMGSSAKDGIVAAACKARGIDGGVNLNFIAARPDRTGDTLFLQKQGNGTPPSVGRFVFLDAKWIERNIGLPT